MEGMNNGQQEEPADGPPGPLPTAGLAALRIPPSAVSISYALDQLDAELEAEEEEEEGNMMAFGSTDSLGGHCTAGCDDEAAPTSATTYGTLDPRLSAAIAMESHPLGFTTQYPSISIVTTAALPWLTGTAVNPALRAAYLWHRGHAVSLLVPWVPPHVQPRLFPDGVVFDTPEEQAKAVEQGIRQRVPFDLPPLTLATLNPPEVAVDTDHETGEMIATVEGGGDEEYGEAVIVTEENRSSSSPSIPSFQLVFYSGRYDPALGSIIPEVDLQPLVPRPVDCIILEEPEHLTWYHTGRRWTRAFPRTVPIIGVMHTNYVDYARRVAGDAAAGTLKRLNRFLCRQHTHKVIKLSDAVQALPRQETCFVHGVSDTFLAVGQAEAADVAPPTTDVADTDTATDTAPSRFTKGAYFLGKALWAKGFEELLERFTAHKARCDAAGQEMAHVDVYGKGEELEEIRAEATARGLPMSFLGAKDHLSPDIGEYRLFVNPSTSDVVATTSAEALAMGKWLLVPLHPCNVFLSSFTNCIVYANDEEFSAGLERGLAHDPAPLSAEEIQKLSWDAATDRLLHCCASVEIGRGGPVARVAAKTGWVGYNVGHGVYSVVSGAIESVKKAMPPLGEGRAGVRRREEGATDVLSHAIALTPTFN